MSHFHPILNKYLYPRLLVMPAVMLQSFLELSYISEALQVTIIAIFVALIAAKYLSKDVLSRYPLINDKQPGEFFYIKRKLHFVTHAKELIEEGFTKVSNVVERKS